MSDDSKPQTVTPERQIAATQIGQVFNSMHAYLTTLQHKNDKGESLTSMQMQQARIYLENASFWAIKHVLTHGVPAAPKPAANDTPAQPPADAPPSNVGEVVADLADAPTGADALPPTTPTESM